MVMVTSSKVDGSNRLTVPMELSKILDLMPGDHMIWQVIDGRIVLSKMTKTYLGKFDFEKKEIEEKLMDYEREHSPSDFMVIPRDGSEEEVAGMMYLADKKAREARRAGN